MGNWHRNKMGIKSGYRPWDPDLRFGDGGSSIIKISSADPLIIECLEGSPQVILTPPTGAPVLGETWNINITLTTLDTNINRIIFFHRQGAAGFVNVTFGNLYFSNIPFKVFLSLISASAKLNLFSLKKGLILFLFICGL